MSVNPNDLPLCSVHPGIPAVRTCARCGRFACDACLVGLKCNECASIRQLPWDNRGEIGVIKAWWRTAVLCFKEPRETFRLAQESGNMGSSILFGAIAMMFGIYPTIALMVPFFGVAALVDKSSMKAGEFAIMGAAALFYVVLAPIMGIFSMLFTSLFDHLGLLVVGGKPGSLERTIIVNAFALSGALLGLIPACGPYAMGAAALVFRILGLMTVHNTNGWRASFAVLWPVVLCCGAYAALIALGAVMAAMGR